MPNRRAIRFAVGAVVSAALFALIARAIIALPPVAEGLSVAMTDGAAQAGIKNVVTAVLLDFRGYDTLLEIAVLMLATVAVLAVRENPHAPRRRIEDRAGPVLDTLTIALMPLMLLVAGHLFWVGSSEPGGAFQAGAVLGSAVILMALSGYARPGWADTSAMRIILAVGLLAFVAVAIGVMVPGGFLLEYPAASRKSLILVIEALLTLSIGASIGSLFLASASGATKGSKR